MTNEQKKALEEAAEQDGTVTTYSYIRGAQTVLDNPQEWFPLVEDWQLRDENKRLQSELSRHRTALEEIESNCDNQNPTHEVFWKIAKEALKNNEG